MAYVELEERVATAPIDDVEERVWDEPRAEESERAARRILEVAALFVSGVAAESEEFLKSVRQFGGE